MDNTIWCDTQAVHIAVVVSDIEKVLKTYCRLFQTEMPAIKQTAVPETANVRYKGLPTPARAKQSFLQFGRIRVEFLEPDEHDSTWREYLDRHGNIVHHIAFNVEDMGKALSVLEEEGMEVIQSGNYNGGKSAYIESENELGVMLELLQNDK